MRTGTARVLGAAAVVVVVAAVALGVVMLAWPDRTVAPTLTAVASPVPSPSPGPPAVPVGEPAAGTGTGYLSADGASLVDAEGVVVRLTGVSWFGMETETMTVHGLWRRNWAEMIDQMAAMGFNTIRVPFSNAALRADAVVTGVDEALNPDLVGLSPVQVLDKVVERAGSLGMRVLLDRHRPTISAQSALWYTDEVGEQQWIADWVMLAERYAGDPTVIGADLHNEPRAEGTDPEGTGACWGCADPARDWPSAAERAGEAILAVEPNWLIVVEGVSCLSGGEPDRWDAEPDQPCGWWGGNLSGVRDRPVKLSRQDKLVYSAHEYASSVAHQTWFDAQDFPDNLPALWESFWGFLRTEQIAPVFLGEFGSTLADPRDAVWLAELLAYLGTDADAIGFAYWSWNPNSADTGGVLTDDWCTVDGAKYAVLAPFLNPPQSIAVADRATAPAPTGVVSDAMACTAG